MKFRLYGGRVKTINNKESRSKKLAQKDYKIRHGLVGKVIRWELCKRLKFDHSIKCYMHNPVSIQENETHNSLVF